MGAELVRGLKRIQLQGWQPGLPRGQGEIEGEMR